jgi:hypothetical protein
MEYWNIFRFNEKLYRIKKFEASTVFPLLTMLNYKIPKYQLKIQLFCSKKLGKAMKMKKDIWSRSKVKDTK